MDRNEGGRGGALSCDGKEFDGTRNCRKIVAAAMAAGVHVAGFLRRRNVGSNKPGGGEDIDIGI